MSQRHYGSENEVVPIKAKRTENTFVSSNMGNIKAKSGENIIISNKSVVSEE